MSYSLQRSIETAQSAPPETLQALSKKPELALPSADRSLIGEATEDYLSAGVDTLANAVKRSVETDVPDDRLENGDIVFLSQDHSQPLWLSQMLAQADLQIDTQGEQKADYTNVGIVTTQGDHLKVVHVPMDQGAAHEVVEEPLADYLSRGGVGRVMVYRLKAPTADLQQAIATAASAYHQEMTVAPLAESPRLLSPRLLSLKELTTELADRTGAIEHQVCGSLVLDAYLAADIDLTASQSAKSADPLLDFWLGDRCPTPESLASHANLRLVSQFLPAGSMQSSLD
ncbi:MAG: hypothetical protein AAFQ74_05590 [Cyanobacteria bacterium J06623_4]